MSVSVQTNNVGKGIPDRYFKFLFGIIILEEVSGTFPEHFCMDPNYDNIVSFNLSNMKEFFLYLPAILFSQHEKKSTCYLSRNIVIFCGNQTKMTNLFSNVQPGT